MLVTRNVFLKYHSPTNGDGGDGGGSGGGSGSGDGGGDNGDDGKGGTPPGDGGDDKTGDDKKGGPRKMSDEEARLLKENMKKKEQLDHLFEN